MSIPIPVVNILTRTLAGASCYQDITVTPVMASTIESSVESVLRAVNSVRSKLDESKIPYSTSPSGCFQANMNTLEEAVAVRIVLTFGAAGIMLEKCRCYCCCMMMADVLKNVSCFFQFVHNTIKAADIPGSSFHCGVDLHCADAYNAETSSYFIDGPNGAPKTGTELAMYLAGMYVTSEVMTFEDPFLQDVASLSLLRQKIVQAVADRKSEVSADRLPYCAKGVGGNPDCHAQIVADMFCATAEELRAIVSTESEVENSLLLWLFFPDAS